MPCDKPTMAKKMGKHHPGGYEKEVANRIFKSGQSHNWSAPRNAMHDYVHGVDTAVKRIVKRRDKAKSR